MKKLVATLFFVSCLVAASSYAREPLNLSIAKQHVIKYHDSGEYDKDIKKVINQAMRFLKIYQSRQLHTNKKPAIILDIDETALSNYEGMLAINFGGTLKQFNEHVDKGIDPVITATLELYRYAKDNGFAVFFITGRQGYERKITEENLKNAGYENWDGLVLREGEYQSKSAAEYKTAIRKQFVDKGYDIILNIGDQKSDLTGGYADKGYKLPNPFYLIP